MNLFKILFGTSENKVKEKFAKDWWEAAHPIKGRLFGEEPHLIEAFVAGFCKAKILIVDKLSEAESSEDIPRQEILEFVLTLGNDEIPLA